MTTSAARHTVRQPYVWLTAVLALCFVVSASAETGSAGAWAIAVIGVALSVLVSYMSTRSARATQSRRFRALAEHASDLEVIVDREGVLTYASPSARRLIGYDPDELIGKPATFITSGAEREELEEVFMDLLDRPGESRTVSFRLAHPRDGWRNFEGVWTNLVDDLSVAGIVINARDVTARADLEQKLQHAAFHDSLTGLPNRALMKDRLEHAIHRAARSEAQIAVLFIDLDHFKTINDNHGHRVGDLVLREVARRLASAVRASDTVARLGGDEFAVVIEAPVDPMRANAAANRMLDVLRPELKIEGLRLRVDASVGVACVRAGSTSVEDLLHDADVAMYEAKEDGRGRVASHDERLSGRLHDERTLARDLREAIEAGELELAFQPIYALPSQEPRGLEAFVRWTHPTRGTVAPAEFLPVADSAGLMRPLGQWVRQEACSRMVRAKHQGLPGDLYLTLNVSATEISSNLFIEDVRSALEGSGLRPGDLVLEITEETLMNVPGVLQRLLALSALGVRLALDDFGTGYSSISYLQQIPIETLKIDRSFVGMIGQPDRRGDVVVSSIVQLARSMDLAVVAEGVERRDQLEFLVDEGCSAAQGYYLHEPATLQQVADELQRVDEAASSSTVISR